MSKRRDVKAVTRGNSCPFCHQQYPSPKAERKHEPKCPRRPVRKAR